MLPITQLLSLVCLCAVFSATAAGDLRRWQIQGRIVGGSSASEGQFPYHVSLRNKKNDLHFCGGALISSRHILTAGHCFFKVPKNTDVFYGLVNMTHATDAGIRVELMQLIFHPEFGKKVPRPDVAIIVTKEPVNFSEFVQPLKLPTQKIIESGAAVVISGWGLCEVPKSTKEMLFNPKRPKTLQYKETTTISLTECAEDFAPLKESDADEWKQVVDDLVDGMICTKNSVGSGSCIGDSGGPLVSNNTLIGVVSWSVGCGDGYPTIYTSVASEIDWLNEAMSNDGQ